MAGVEQVDLGIRNIALQWFRTGRYERRIITSPNHQSRWLVLAQPRLPRRIGRHICPIIVQQTGLDLALAGSRQVRVLVSPSVRVITFGMRSAEGVTLLGRCERHERIEHFWMRFRIVPISRNAGPLGTQAFPVGIGVLDDKRLQPLGMRRHDAKADRPTIVMKEEGVFVDLELLEKAVDRLGQIVKGIRIRRRWRGVTLTESRKIRRYEMIACGEQGDERIEL